MRSFTIEWVKVVKNTKELQELLQKLPPMKIEGDLGSAIEVECYRDEATGKEHLCFQEK